MLLGAGERRRGAIARVRLCAECSVLGFREGSRAASSLQTCARFNDLFLCCVSKAVGYLKLKWNYLFDY